MIYSQTILSGNLYQENPYFLNPAYAGYREILSVSLDYRQTANTVKGAPVLIAAAIDMPVLRGMSLGTRFFKQSEGLFNNLSFFLDYSYRFRLNSDQTLSFGMATGLKSNQINYSEIVADDPSAIIDIASKNFEGVFFQGAAGITYNRKLLEIAFSVPQLFETKKSINPDYFSMVSYKFILNKKNLTLKPSVLLKYKSNTPLTFNTSLNAYWKDFFCIGAGYINRPALVFLTGFNFRKFSISYATEMGLQKNNSAFTQLHEISITYSLKNKKTAPIDTTKNQEFPLVAKNDSIKTDSMSQNTKNNNVQLNDTLQNTVVQLETDSLNSAQSHHSTDSTNIENETFKPNIEDYEIIYVGDGLYSVKLKNPLPDSLTNIPVIDSSLSKNYTITDELIDKISKENNNENEDVGKGYYTIQLMIDETNKYILRDAEIATNTNFDRTKEGKFLYYFGHYKSIEEAEEDLPRLKSYPNLEFKIINIKQ